MFRAYLTNRPASLAAAVIASSGLALIGALGCSFGTFDRVACAMDGDCTERYGAGASCGSEGFCASGSGMDGPPTQALAPTCLGEDIPEMSSSAEFVQVTTVGLGNDIDDVACLPARAEGDEGFLRVTMTAGEKWHFHVRKVDPASDPVVYVLPACDARACAPGSATNVCGPDTDEHLSFVAPAAGTYLIGVDGRSAGGYPFQLLAIRPTCGNGGMPEHSEGCDDGNTIDGDGCDSRCRSEVGPAAPMEKEPNDEFTSANLLTLPAGGEPLNVSGQLGSACDIDLFVLTLPAASKVEVAWLDSLGMPCEAQLAGSKLEILAADGLTMLHAASASDAENCPSFGEDKAVTLPAGTYHIRATAPGNRGNYQLAVTANPT